MAFGCVDWDKTLFFADCFADDTDLIFLFDENVDVGLPDVGWECLGCPTETGVDQYEVACVQRIFEVVHGF